MSNYGNDYLIHYGVKNMKWGVRRYQNEDGSLTQLGKEHYGVGSTESQGNQKFQKKYEHETKKLSKLEDRADLAKQAANAITYDKRADNWKKVGRGALAVAVPATVSGAMTDKTFNRKAKQDLSDIADAARWKQNSLDRVARTNSFIDDSIVVGANNNASSAGVANAILDVSRIYGNVATAAEAVSRHLPSVYDHNGLAVVAGTAKVAAAAAYGASAYNRIQSNLAKHRLTDKGHAKAVARRDAQYQKISNMVKDTPYMALFKDQIEAYKKEHPNSELSDKQIMKNLM